MSQATSLPPQYEQQAPAPKKKGKGTWILLIIVAVVAIIVITQAGGGDNPSQSTASGGDSSSDSAQAVGLNQPVRDGKFEFRVLSIERAKSVSDPTGNPYMTTTAQGEFIVITMSVTNIGNEAQNYFGQNQKVIDANGREYEANSAAGMWMNSGLSIMGDINPATQFR